MTAIRARIASRALGPGDRLPSIRAFAKTMEVSPSTVVEAYDRLVAEGLIRARVGSGFYVSASALPPLAYRCSLLVYLLLIRYSAQSIKSVNVFFFLNILPSSYH